MCVCVHIHVDAMACVKGFAFVFFYETASRLGHYVLSRDSRIRYHLRHLSLRVGVGTTALVFVF